MQKITDWLESYWVTPAYAGWLLLAIAICFFGAATNTMAGWLYVLSGMIFALLAVGAILPGRSLRQIQIRRQQIVPVSRGDRLTIELEIINSTPRPINLLEVKDLLPYPLATPSKTSIEVIPPHKSYHLVDYPTTQRRGVYRWQEVELKTGTPIGLFWCRRSRQVPAKAIVYPQVLPLTRCPLIDNLGTDESISVESDRVYQPATEGLTRTLRPYRHGDATRLIHWRSSARFGELKVRELERITGSQEVIICLDNATIWEEQLFEQAVIAAASLYFYASRCQLNAKLWTANTGLLHGNQVILEALAATNYGEDLSQENLPTLPLVWLTCQEHSLINLPIGSRWLLFLATQEVQPAVNTQLPGLAINRKQPLTQQLQNFFSPTGFHGT